MPIALRNADPDVREIRLGSTNGTYGFALVVKDRFTRAPQLLGSIIVRVANKPLGKPFLPYAKPGEATFLFRGLPPGAYDVQVQSNAPPDADNSATRSWREPPYYQDTSIHVQLPMTNVLWPAFPDAYLANQGKPLDDPTQPAAYRQQHLAAMLQPAPAYPFPPAATLVRGIVRSGAQPLEDVRVAIIAAPPIPGKPPGYVRADQDIECRTREDGEYVLYFPEVVGKNEQFTLRATHSSGTSVDSSVRVWRGITVTSNIALAL